MEPRYLLDTNICIYIRQKRPDEVLRRFRKLRPGEAVLSVITYGELLYGVAKSQQRVAALERLRELVNLLPALSLPETAAEAYGTIRAGLEAKGEMIGNNDLWDRRARRSIGFDAGYKQRKGVPASAWPEGAKLGRLSKR